LRVIAEVDSRLILRRAKALFHVPQLLAWTRPVDSSLCRRPFLSRRSARRGRSRRRGKPICSLCGEWRSSTDLYWVMDAACCRRRVGDSGHRDHSWAPVRVVVGGLCGRGFVSGNVRAGSLVRRCSLVWPQTHHITLDYHRQKPPSRLDMDAGGCAYATCAGMRSSSSVPAFPSLQTRR
jgi:hypothetical protein